MKKILVTLMTLGFLSSAQAGFYGNVGLDLGLSGESEQGTTTNDLDNNPMLLDFQLGWSSLGLSVGLDYEMSLQDLEFDDGSEVALTTYGIFVGYEFPILFRVYGAYMLGGKAAEGVSNNDFEGVSGTKLGVGYTGFPLIDIYLEMRSYSYDEANGNPLTNEIDLSMTTLGVAFSF